MKHFESIPVAGSGQPTNAFVSSDSPTETISLAMPLRKGPLPRYITVLPEGRFVPLNEDRMVVGADPSCDLVLMDPRVSRRHCRLERSKDTWWVRDCGSKNGTFLNGIRISKAEVRAEDALEVGGLVLKLTATRQSQAGQDKVFCGEMVSSDPVMLEIFRTIESLASTGLNVCVRGESGTGKELVARALHDLGPRRDGPFVPVNCGALPAELLESELFGYEKGAFTGADKAKPGMFEVAHRGTLFLDEIGELPLDQQAALLRVLDSGEIRRLGASRMRSVDVRVVCATNRPLERLVDWGLFRRDLFYRLWEASVILPPLRERGGDVMLLVRHFATRVKGEKRCPDPTYAQASRLMEYRWPGNVRQLRSVVRRAGALGWDAAIESLDPVAVPGEEASVPDTEPLEGVDKSSRRGGGAGSVCAESQDAVYQPDLNGVEMLGRLEEKLILEALRHTGGNQSRAARMLGMHRSTLRQKVRRMKQR